MKFIKSTLCKIALEIKTGKTPPTSNQEYFGDELNWYTPTDLDREKILGKSKRRITQKAFDDKKVVVLKPNTVLLGCIGDIGKIGLIKETATSNQQITGILPNEEVLNSEFLYYWLKHNKNKLKDASTSAIVPILNNKQLSTIKIEFPESLKDQIRIADTLSKSETLISQRKESILMLDEILKSSFLEMFGDPIRNEKNWDISTIGKECNVKGGKRIPKDSKLVKENTGYPYIKAGNIKNGKITTTDLEFLTPELRHLLKRYTVEKGDVCITVVGANIGDIGIVPEELHLANLTENANKVLIKDKLKLNNIYLGFYLMMDFVQNNFNSKIRAAGVPKLALFRIEEISLLMPPIELQNKFVAIVEIVEVLKKEYDASLKELENMYGVLSQKAFSGELVDSEESKIDKEKYDTVMEEKPDEIINIENYTNRKKDKVDITNMTFADYVGFPEELQISDEKWMAKFLGKDEFYQFLLKDHFKDVSFNLGDIEMKFHNFFYHVLDMDFDNEPWRSAIFEFMKADPPLIIQKFDKDSATIKLQLTDEAYKA